MSDARREIDVSSLPEGASGPRTPLWWGVALMIAIEGTMFLLALVSYFYIRGNFRLWPPTLAGDRATLFAGVGLLALIASVPPMALCSRAAVRHELRPARFWLIVGTALGLVFLATRFAEFFALPFRWDSSAYGSIIWTTLGLHTFHGIASNAENLLLITLLFRGPVEKEHFTDLEVNSLYWYFVVAVLSVLYPVFYLEKVLVP